MNLKAEDIQVCGTFLCLEFHQQCAHIYIYILYFTPSVLYFVTVEVLERDSWRPPRHARMALTGKPLQL